jgi:hypothetical protein
MKPLGDILFEKNVQGKKKEGEKGEIPIELFDGAATS